MNTLYAQSFLTAACVTLEQMFDENFELGEEVKQLDNTDIKREIVVQIHYSGSVSGFYLACMDYSTAKFLLEKLLGKDVSRELLFSLLKEFLNVAVGEAFNSLLEDFPSLTFMAPSVYHSPVDLPEMSVHHGALTHESRIIDFYFCMDRMSLKVGADLKKVSNEKEKLEQLTKKLERVNKSLEEEKEKSRRLLRKAEEAAKLKSEFLAVMSHEMRTPLNAVTGFTDILLDESLTSEQRDMLNTIKRSSDSLLDVINDVLDLSKLEAGGMEIDEVEFDLEEVAYDSAEIARSKVSTQTVEINVDMCDIYSRVLGDSTKVRQVLINLMGNAIKFTSDGEVLLKIESTMEDQKFIHLKFRVIDTGIGMTAEQCKKIFKPFQQADSSTTRKYGGTGLGLSISKGMVEAMGGVLEVKSKPGAGSEFFFELKFKKVEQKTLQKNAVLSEKGTAILIDDNENARNILKYQLEKMGLDVDGFESYESAVKEIKGKNYNIAFIDLMMPGKDGFEVLNMFKEAGVAKTYIAQTGMVRPQMKGRIKNSVFDTYLTKPVRPETLERVISKTFSTTKVELPQQKEIEFDGIVLNILVAEDNEINQRLINKVLTKMGHKITIVEDGQKAINALEEDTFDVVFMDMLMPVMDGVKATAEIRKNSKHKDLPIIAMTANAMGEFKEQCLEAGMNDYVTKPVRRDRIWQVFNDHCYEKPLPTYSEQPRVLVIEDDRVIQKIISYFFETKMPTVSWKIASDGVEACTLIGSMKPHLILTDILMPNMDGVEVVKYLRGNDEYKDTSVIVLTTLEGEHEKIKELRKLGVIEVFKKPLKNHVLFHTIRNELQATLMEASEIY